MISTDHFWTGDGNRCSVTGYDGPICSRCGLADVPTTPITCPARVVEEDLRPVGEKLDALAARQQARKALSLPTPAEPEEETRA